MHHVPIPLVHIHTNFKIPEMIEYRDRLAREWNLMMICGMNGEALAAKETFPDGNTDRITCCKNLKTTALKQTLSGEGKRYRFDHEQKRYRVDTGSEPFTGVIAGVRSDEEGSRSKERYFSPRDRQNEWDVGDQPPEFRSQFKTDFAPGTHVRIHPLLDWTELNIWEYIKREKIPTVSLYYNQGDGKRYRSVGCYPCTFPNDSRAENPDEIIGERGNWRILRSVQGEPGTRKMAAGWKACAGKGTCRQNRGQPQKEAIMNPENTFLPRKQMELPL